MASPWGGASEQGRIHTYYMARPSKTVSSAGICSHYPGIEKPSPTSVSGNENDLNFAWKLTILRHLLVYVQLGDHEVFCMLLQENTPNTKKL